MKYGQKKYDFIVPIPSSKKMERIEENLAASNIELTYEEYLKIKDELSKIQIHGNRTDEDMAKLWSLKD